MSELKHLFDPILLFGALGTMAILSLVFKENRFYRIFEHVFLGLALGYDLEITWTIVLRPQFWDPMVQDGQWAWILAVPVGLMFYGVYTQRFAWMSRVIFGIFFGLAAGTVFQDFSARIMPQVLKSFSPKKSLIPPPPTPGDPHALLHQISFVLNNALFLAILGTSLFFVCLRSKKQGRLVDGPIWSLGADVLVRGDLWLDDHDTHGTAHRPNVFYFPRLAALGAVR
jgi:hypothetical protein